MEGIDIQSIINGGSTGLVVLMVLYLAFKEGVQFKRDKMTNKTMNNHFQHINDTNEEFIKVIQKSNDIQEGTREVIKENTIKLGEVSGVIQKCKRF